MNSLPCGCLALYEMTLVWAEHVLGFYLGHEPVKVGLRKHEIWQVQEQLASLQGFLGLLKLISI